VARGSRSSLMKVDPSKSPLSRPSPLACLPGTRVVLDGDIAPSAWTARGNRRPSLSIGLRIGSDARAGLDLNALLSYCGRTTVAACPFSAGSASSTRAKFNTLLARLLQGPIRFGSVSLTYAQLLGEIDDGLDLSQLAVGEYRLRGATTGRSRHRAGPRSSPVAHLAADSGSTAPSSA
jgi:hypothetical protein